METESSKALDRALSSVDPQWHDAEIEHALIGLHLKRRRRSQVQGGLAAAGVVLLSLGVFQSFQRPPAPIAAAPGAPSARPTSATPVEPSVMRFADGSTAKPLDARSELKVRHVSESLVALDIAQGAAQFSVQRDASRLFRVEAGGVVVEVLGTLFTVDRRATEVYVGVEEGRVLVRWANEVRTVNAGEAQTFPSLPTAPPPSNLRSSEHPEASEPPPPRSREPSWKQHARQGRYEQAFRSLGVAPSRDRPKGLDELLLASDSARLSGHPEAALPYLKGIVQSHPKDPRAALAAFTLGRVYLQELHQPQLAAGAFEKTRKLNPQGSLAEDALAREVEAWSKANAPGRAKARAQEYLDKYPEGHRASSVRVFGGLE